MIFAPMVVNVGGFKVNVLDRMSFVGMAPFQQNDIFLSTKRNQGLGEQNGDLSPTLLPVDFVNDQDASDSNSVKNSVV